MNKLKIILYLTLIFLFIGCSTKTSLCKYEGYQVVEKSNFINHRMSLKSPTKDKVYEVKTYYYYYHKYSIGEFIKPCNE